MGILKDLWDSLWEVGTSSYPDDGRGAHHDRVLFYTGWIDDLVAMRGTFPYVEYLEYVEIYRSDYIMYADCDDWILIQSLLEYCNALGFKSAQGTSIDGNLAIYFTIPKRFEHIEWEC